MSQAWLCLVSEQKMSMIGYIPEGFVKLYITPPARRKLEEVGQWPDEIIISLTVNYVAPLFYIHQEHPEYRHMFDAFGTPKAKRTWQRYVSRKKKEIQEFIEKEGCCKRIKENSSEWGYDP